LADLQKELAGATKELPLVEKRLAESEKALRDFGLEWYAKGLDIQGEHAAATEIRNELIKTTEDKVTELAVEEAKKAGKKPPGGGGDPGASGGGGGVEGGGSAAAGGTKAEAGATKEIAQGSEKATAEGVETGVKVVEESGSKTVGKFAGKAAPLVGIGVAGYFAVQDYRQGNYVMAGVDALEAVPVVGEVALAGDIMWHVFGPSEKDIEVLKGLPSWRRMGP
jgi:hypothetical protein